MLHQTTFAQETPSNSKVTQVGSQTLTTSFHYSAMGGERYSNDDDKGTTNVGIGFDYLTFFADKFAAGPKLNLHRLNDGNTIQTSLNISLKTAYFFDNGSNTIPYIGGSLGHLFVKYDYGDKNETAVGIQGDLSAGLALRKGHLLILLETGYTYQRARHSLTKSKRTAKNFYLSIGFGASFYKD